jgi:hypothetical protein
MISVGILLVSFRLPLWRIEEMFAQEEKGKNLGEIRMPNDERHSKKHPVVEKDRRYSILVTLRNKVLSERLIPFTV